MSKVRPALALSFATEYSKQLIHFVSVIILARLLTPEQIGIYSVAMVVVMMLHALREFGTGQYVIRESTLTDGHMRSAIGVLYLTSWALGLLLVAGSPLVARYYAEPGLRSILLVLACNFFIMPLGGVTFSYLRRQMDFGKLYRAQVSANLTYGVVVVTLALIGFGYMSMAYAALSSTVVSVLLLNAYRPSYVPFLPSFRTLSGVISFGSFASGASVLGRLAESLPELVIGRLLSMAAVGYFSRAAGLIMIFNRAVTFGVRPVLLPHFSARQREGASAADAYVRAVSLFTAVAWPFYGFLALMAYPVVRILYGPQWDLAVPVAQVLCVWGAFEALFAFTGEILIAAGAVRKMFLRQATVVPLRLLFILGGVHYGLVGVAAGLGLAGVLEFLISARYVRQAVGVGVRELVGCSGKGIVVTLYALALPATVAATADIGPHNVWGPFLLAAAGGAAGWLLGVHRSGHELAAEVSALWLRVRRKALPGSAH